MFVKNIKNNYTKETAGKYIENDKPIYFLSSRVETMYEYENNQRTGEIKGFKYHFVQDGVNPFVVKFKNELKEIPPILTEVSLPDLEAIEVRNKVHFRATQLEVTQ